MATKYNYSDQQSFDRSVLENAKYFTAFLYGGPFSRIKIKRKEYEDVIVEAKKLAATADRPVLIYAVSDRHSCHIGNVTSTGTVTCEH